MSRQDPIKNRVTMCMLVFIFMGCLILGRAIDVQIIRDSRIESLAKRQFQSKVLIRPRRGSILDRNLEPLAINVEIQSLAANPTKANRSRSLAHLLVKITDLSYEKILEKLREKKEFVWIKRHLSDYEVSKLKRAHLMDPLGNLSRGLFLIKESKRVYPHGELASHVLGDVNVDSEGLEGVELLENVRLTGKNASVSSIKDAFGRPTFFDVSEANHLKEGEQVVLTLDASLQFSVEQELKKATQKTGAQSGSVIVMNASNGEILALANEPSFNPNDKNIASSKRRNRAITDGYEPGSTLKAVLLASALSQGWKLSDKVWGERGSFLIQGKQITEAEKHEQFEWLTLKEIIQFSSNIGAAKLALRLGSDSYFNTLKLFGFGNKTGVDFPGEISGKVPAKKLWQPLSLATIGFGQGIFVTPIQMIRAYASFANGGLFVKPTLIKNAIKKGDLPKRILSKKVSESVLEALLSTTEGKGTGVKAALEGYEVAGKTGTAQVVDSSTGKYSSSKYIASFIGFPLGVEPKVVIFTSLDGPKGIYYASETAAPLFREVLNAVANRFSLPAKASPILAKENPEKAPYLKDELKRSLAKVMEVGEPESLPSIEWYGETADGTALLKMPLLQKLTLRETLRSLQGHSFEVVTHGNGVVKSQSPEPGKSIANDGVVKLYLEMPE